PIHIKDNLQLKPEEYVVLLKGVEVGRGDIMTGHHLAIDPGNAEKGLEGIPTKEPAFGLPAMWVDESMKEQAKLLGYTVVNPAIVVVTHLTELIRANSCDILTRQDVQTLLDGLAKSHPKVVEELIPTLMSTGSVQKVLKNLLKERIPIRDILSIVETLADFAPLVKDTDRLTDFVRQALARTITKTLTGADGTVTVMILDPAAEEVVMSSIHETEHGTMMALEPTKAEALLISISEGMQAMAGEGHQPVLMTSPEIRRFVKNITERVLPSLIVISSSEIAGNVNIKNYKVVKLS
ncbi:MAG: flagellar biosynthesis protein FlhA, partial [Thermodesulfobacteriota bacterium]